MSERVAVKMLHVALAYQCSPIQVNAAVCAYDLLPLLSDVGLRLESVAVTVIQVAVTSRVRLL